MGFQSSGPSDPISLRRREALGRLGVLPFLLAACGRAAPPPPVVAAGKLMPAVDLPDLAGRRIKVGGGGRPLLLNFWATWCSPCRAEMAVLERLHRRLGPAGLLVAGISVDGDVNLVREFILQQGLDFVLLWDQAGEMTRKALGIRTFPTTVLVRRDGVIADVMAGERTWDSGTALEAVQSLL